MKKTAIALVMMICGAAAAAEPVKYSAQRTAVRDQGTRLGFFHAMKADCASTPVEVRVVTQPTNGSVTVVEAAESPRLAADHPFAECNKAKVTGKLVNYRAAPGYYGRDTVIVEASYPDGSVAQHTYRIDVLEKLPEVAVRIDAEEPEEEQALPEPRVSRAPPTRQFGPYRFDCDTPGGNFSTWSAPVPGARTIVTGNIKMMEARKHATFVPGGSVALMENDDKGVKLDFIAYPQKPGSIYAAVSIAMRPRVPPRMVAVATLGAGETIPFEVRFEPGVLEVRVGSVDKRIDVPGLKATRVELLCSTGNFLFENTMITD